MPWWTNGLNAVKSALPSVSRLAQQPQQSQQQDDEQQPQAPPSSQTSQQSWFSRLTSNYLQTPPQFQASPPLQTAFQQAPFQTQAVNQQANSRNSLPEVPNTPATQMAYNALYRAANDTVGGTGIDRFELPPSDDKNKAPDLIRAIDENRNGLCVVYGVETAREHVRKLAGIPTPSDPLTDNPSTHTFSKHAYQIRFVPGNAKKGARLRLGDLRHHYRRRIER